MSDIEYSKAPGRSAQFTLRRMLLWVFIVGVALTAGRWIYVRTALQAKIVATLKASQVDVSYAWLNGERIRRYVDNPQLGMVVCGVSLPVPMQPGEDARKINALLLQLPHLREVCVRPSVFGTAWPDRWERAGRETSECVSGLRINRIVIQIPLQGEGTADWIVDADSIEEVAFENCPPPPLTVWSKICDSSHVTRLSFAGTALSAEHLRLLGNAAQLRDLRLHCEMPIDELVALGGRNSCNLDLRLTNVTEEDLAAVAKLTNLTSLSLCLESPTEKGVAALAKAARLRVLNLQDAIVSNAAIAAIADSSSLETLVVSGTDVTEDALRPLSRCQSLRQLIIPDSLDLARVRAELPQVREVSTASSSPQAQELRKSKKDRAARSEMDETNRNGLSNASDYLLR
ncbi:MAG: hypothetical protein L0211_24565 [Planctomycetaceae bacterium]|nr:hypothetical protein [Planctomycetaceae bacterium]